MGHDDTSRLREGADNKQVPNQGGQQIRDALEAVQQRWGPLQPLQEKNALEVSTEPEYSMPVTTAAVAHSIPVLATSHSSASLAVACNSYL